MTTCPLCRESFDDSSGLDQHLADNHGLFDDPGSTTHFQATDTMVRGGTATAIDLDVQANRRAAMPSLAGLPPGVSPTRVYDPSAEDPVWRSITIGFAGLVLVVLVALSVL